MWKRSYVYLQADCNIGPTGFNIRCGGTEKKEVSANATPIHHAFVSYRAGINQNKVEVVNSQRTEDGFSSDKTPE